MALNNIQWLIYHKTQPAQIEGHFKSHLKKW